MVAALDDLHQFTEPVDRFGQQLSGDRCRLDLRHDDEFHVVHDLAAATDRTGDGDAVAVAVEDPLQFERGGFSHPERQGVGN